MAKVTAYSKGDMVDGISHVSVELDESLLSRVVELSRVIRDNDVDYVSEFTYVDAFDGGDSVRVDCVMLVVGRDDFHFEGNFKGSSEEWYTDGISLDGKCFNEWSAV